eukprot:CAMPEP_0202821326 /NCGR_PEP_ID=MMETSP1389-20130828/10311_1 /ASSEMBLY_ACC=CAM_ASM_000865 /TAXON_ID=302021 /ORGANISM="Rhodomonas sp., Strain CCMP768" /LENGTH=126 /DNA_ID=CAMNT_0049494083 /DNA_START=100 /DNA_END=480 /DNA_ORIENTATION=-
MCPLYASSAAGSALSASCSRSRRARSHLRGDRSTPTDDRPTTLAAAGIVPMPQKGSMTCDSPTTSLRKRAPSIAAFTPIAFGQSMRPRGKISGVLNLQASKRAGPRAKQMRCVNDGRASERASAQR